VAFEHGTLRNIPFQDNFKGASTALTYKLADKVIITNCDNIVATEKLGLDNFEFLPHPVNEDGLENCNGINLRNELLKEYEADYIVLHPARQHWSEERHPDWEKGNDIFIKGFARFIQDVNPKAMGVFVEWGRKVKETKDLLGKLGISDRVTWVKPMHHHSMIRHIKASDLVADQFYLGAFGSITPKALMCGKVTMLRLDEEIHEWAFSEPPPVLNTGNDDDVFEKLKLHYTNKAFRMKLEEASRNWYQNFHSADVITNKLINIYKEL
jgi:glycosyltransferase involved in cell wall biosynthesis